VYVPLTAPGGIWMVICGSQVTTVSPTSEVAENAVRGAARVPGVPGVNVPVPEDPTTSPGS
jgi:hypothetical protein